MILSKHFYVVKLKRNFFTLLFTIFLLFLLLYSTSNLIAIKDSLVLWSTAVVPSLFPFFVATELLSHTNFVNILREVFNKIYATFI